MIKAVRKGAMRKSTFIILLMTAVSALNLFGAVVDLIVWNLAGAFSALTCIVVAVVTVFSQLTIRNLSDTL
jgi:hypothetical protein